MRVRAKRLLSDLRTVDSGSRRFLAPAATLLACLFSAGSLPAQSTAATAPGTPASAVAQPSDAGSLGTGSGPGSTPASTSPNVPNVLDGLESLQLVKNPDFGPPIIEAGDLYQGQLNAGTARQGGGDSSFMKPLEPNLNGPDLAAPTFEAALETAPLYSPNMALPTLEMPDTFGPSMTGSPLETLELPGASMQRRPLGTIGAPTFLNTKHSFPLGNSRVRFGVAVDVGAAYNNNIFAAPKNPQGDTILTLQPSFYLETGKKGTIRFLWAPSVLEYAKYKQFNSVNQTFVFSSRYRWTKLRVGLDASYLAQSGLFLNSQGQAQQKSVFVRMFAGYALTKKVDLNFNFDGLVTESSPGGRQFQGTLTAAVDYRFTRKTAIGTAISLGYFYSPTGMTTSESFLLRLLYNPTSKLVFRGEGGLQFRQSSSSAGGSSSAVTTVMNMSLTYNPTSKTYVSLRLFRNVDMDAFNAGNLQITTSVESNGSWRVSRSLTLSGALAAGRVENISMSGQQVGTYNYVQANLGASYLLTDEVNLSLFNNLQQRLGDTQGNNYLSNTSGMSLGMRF